MISDCGVFPPEKYIFRVGLITSAGLPLLVAFLLASSCNKPGTAAFPITRAEFQKDREWIENIQKKPKSNG